MKFSFTCHTALIFIWVCFLTLPAFSQKIANSNGTIYAAGYREYKATDSSRRYKPGVANGSRLFYRPEEIDVWYPAKADAGSKPLTYKYFLSLFERRANSFQDSVKYTGLADELLQHFTVGTDGHQTNITTKSFPGVTPAPGHFPVIIYFSSYNGMSYENVPLFENLASHGYIVLSISSIGRYPGNMTLQYLDVIEQVKDAEFALRLTGERDKNTDTTKLGIIGYSYGGVAAALLAMENKQVKAVLSLDGSEVHYYGRDKSEDNDFDRLRRNSHWTPPSFRCAYAYLESDHKSDDGPVDSIYSFPKEAAKKRYYARVLEATHEDFSCVSGLGAGENQIYQSVNQLALDYFEQYLRNSVGSFDAVLGVLSAGKRISLSTQGLTRASGRIILSGEIVDGTTGEPIPYVSIGIPLGNCGTVSSTRGTFRLDVADTLALGVVRISSLGYQPKTFTATELRADLLNKPVIALQRQVNQLGEISVKAGRLRTKVIGNTSQSKFFNVGFPLRDLGSEVGIKVSLGRKKVFIRSFNFNISNMRMDSCTFRLNIYNIQNGKPGDNLLRQNIITRISNKPGAYSIDLRPYHILLNGSVFVSLEWIDGKTTEGHGAVFFSAGLLSSGYHRKTTEADWVKFKGLGAAFNLEVAEE